MKNNYDLFVNRPLVFLCGPKIEDKTRDRRTIVSSFLSSLERKNSEGKTFFQLVPIIVDELFDSSKMKTESLSYKVMEEIVSSISFKTYIFLDTMSTSYEFGLFDNSMVENSVTPFLENDYLKRTTCPVGQYIRMSHKNVDIIKYRAKKNSLNHLSFPKNELPANLKKKIISDEEKIFDSLKEGVSFCFKKNENSPSSNLGEIQFTYDSDSNCIHFNIDVKTFFYFSINCFKWRDLTFIIERKAYKKAIDKVKKTLRLFLISAKDAINDKTKAKLLVSNPRVTIKVGSFSNSTNVLKHILNLSLMINAHMEKESLSGKFLKVGSVLKPDIQYLKYPYFDFYKSFFGLTNHELDSVQRYKYFKNDSLNRLTIKVSGKNRKILSYKTNRKGRQLRTIHSKISSALYSTFEPAPTSYAYHKNCSTIKACSAHINSKHFSKLDICSFFNSIDFDMLNKRIFKKLRSNVPIGMKRIIPAEISLRKYLKCCFADGKLPLGFVSSPILSDIYLNDLDIKLQKRFRNIVYTRYADDILISSAEYSNDLSKCKNYIVKELRKIKLNINSKKKADVNFRNYGDSIHYLGINVVFREDVSELTISKKSLLHYALKILQFKGSHFEQEKGILDYIKNVSFKSYERINKILIFKRKQLLNLINDNKFDLLL